MAELNAKVPSTVPEIQWAITICPLLLLANRLLVLQFLVQMSPPLCGILPAELKAPPLSTVSYFNTD